MRKLYVISVILIFGMFHVFAKSDFRNGYIISIKNDTIYGLIDYRGNKANTKKCIFKKDVYSENQEFTPNDIKAYRFIDSKYYISKIVNSAENTDTLFLEYLIKGKVDMYYFFDGVQGHFLADKGEEKLIELKSIEKEVYTNATTYRIKSNQYVGILNYFFSESPSTLKKVEQVDLTQESLIKIAKVYHNDVCSNEECIIYQKVVPKVIIQYGPLIGFCQKTVSITKNSEIYKYLKNNQFNKEFNPYFGFFIKSNIPSLGENLFLQYEGTYSREDLRCQNSWVSIYNFRYVNDIKLTRNVLNNSFQLKYELTKGRVQPSFHLGGCVNYSFMTQYEQHYTIQDLSGRPLTHTSFYEYPFPNLDFGVKVGFGIVGKVFNDRSAYLDFSYMKSVGILMKLDANVFSLSLGVGIGK